MFGSRTHELDHILRQVRGMWSYVYSRARNTPFSGVVAVLDAALIIFLAATFAHIFWTWVEPDAKGPVGSNDGLVIVSRQPAQRVEQDYGVLLNFDAFNRRPIDVNTPLLAGTEDAPETTLDLKLFGIRAVKESNTGSAIIRTPDLKQSAFHVGEELLDDVYLRRVMPDRVFISRNGVIESLFLDESAARLVSSPMEQGSSIAPPAGAAAQTSPAEVAGLSGASLFEAVQLRPRLNGNTIEGYYVQPKGDGSVFKKMGLQPSDVLIAVNGMRLVNNERIQEAIEELRYADTVVVELERDGRPERITVSLGGRS